MFEVIVYVLLSAASLFFIVLHFFGNRELRNEIAHFPGPKSYPLIGCGYLFIGRTENIWNKLYTIFTTYSSPIRIEVGPWMTVAIHDPEHLKNLLMSKRTIEKPPEIYKFVEHWIGNGLASSKGTTWHVHRKLIQPAFNQQIHKASFDCFHKYSLMLTKSLEKKNNGEEFEILPFLSITAIQIICESTFGVNVEPKREVIEEYIEAGERAKEVLLKRVFSPWLYPDVLFNFTRSSTIFYDSINKMRNFTKHIVKERRSDIQNAAVQNENTLKEKKIFLDLLIELSYKGQKFTEQEIQDQVDTILFAGHDTTSWTICFVILVLASYPEIQDKVYEELYELYGAEDPEKMPMKYEDLKHMQYLERVIKETMRLFPVAPILLRKMVEDFDIGGHTIPKDCGIFISIMRLHRDEKIWPDPLTFNPDRFLPEEVEKRHPYSFIPFLVGPRNCIGRAHAMMTMKTQMGTILRKYILRKDKITPVKNIKVKLDILLRTMEPVTIKIEKRVKEKNVIISKNM